MKQNGKLSCNTIQNIEGVLLGIVKELVDQPDGASVHSTISNGGGTVVMTVRTASGEIGKVIGKAGRNAQAIRLLLDAFAAKYRCRIVMEIDDPRKNQGGGRKRQRGPAVWCPECLWAGFGRQTVCPNCGSSLRLGHGPSSSNGQAVENGDA